MIDLEFRLWDILDGADRFYGIAPIGEETVAELRRLREVSGGWWGWFDEAGELFVPTSEWVAVHLPKGVTP